MIHHVGCLVALSQIGSYEYPIQLVIETDWMFNSHANVSIQPI